MKIKFQGILTVKTIAIFAISCGAVAAWLIAASHFDIERDLEIARENASAINSRDFAASQVCGHEAAWRWHGDELTCLMHSGKTTDVVVVAGEKP